jgi:hypothetical protein
MEKPGWQTLLLAFAAQVRFGLFGKGKPVGHQTVEKALRHVAQTLQLAGYDDPRKTYRAKELDLQFRHLLKSYKDADPAPKPQFALPIPTIRTAASRYEPHHSPQDRAVSDLICVAYFFLLRVDSRMSVSGKTAPYSIIMLHARFSSKPMRSRYISKTRKTGRKAPQFTIPLIPAGSAQSRPWHVESPTSAPKAFVPLPL